MRRAALLALAVVLAGCSGVGTLGGTETRTLTPVAVPSESPAGTPTATATPELSVADAIEDDPLAVVPIHERQIGTSGFSVSVVHALDGGTIYRLNATVVGDRLRGSVRRTAAPVGDRFEQGFYDDGKAMYVRVAGHEADGTQTVSYRSLPPSFSLPFDVTRGDQLRVLLASSDFELVRVVGAGGNISYLRGVAGPTTVDELPAYPAAVRNATVRNLSVTVTIDGVISGYSFDYEGTRDGERVAGRIRVEVDTVERRAPRAPWWFDRALANTSRVAIMGTPRTSLGQRVPVG